MITDEDIRNAWASIARTEAGRIAYLHFQKIRLEVGESNDPSALLTEKGERRLAAKLMGLMASEISETKSDGPGTAADASRAERPVVFASSQPAGRQRRTFREHAIANDPELASSKSP